jgi:hypothetical protein
MVVKKRQADTERMEAEIGQLQSELQALEESRRVRKGEIETLETGLRAQVVRARVAKDPDAQGNIERLAGDIAKLRTDDMFDCDAIGEISASLEAKEAALGRAQWEERCRPLRGMLQSRLTGELEREASKRAEDLKKILGEINASDLTIINEMRGIHRLLSPMGNEVDAVRKKRPDIISCSLEPEMEFPANSQYKENIGRDIQGPAVHVFERALQKLEEVVAMEPAAERV